MADETRQVLFQIIGQADSLTRAVRQSRQEVARFRREAQRPIPLKLTTSDILNDLRTVERQLVRVRDLGARGIRMRANASEALRSVQNVETRLRAVQNTASRSLRLRMNAAEALRSADTVNARLERIQKTAAGGIVLKVDDRQARAAAEALQREAEETARKTREGGDTANRSASEQVRLMRAIRLVGKEARTELTALDLQQRRGVITTREFANAAGQVSDRVRREVREMTADLKEVPRELQVAVRQALNAVDRGVTRGSELVAQQTRLRSRITQGIADAGSQLAGRFAFAYLAVRGVEAIGRALVQTGREVVEFDQKLIGVRKTTGLVGAEFERLKTTLLDLSDRLGVPADKIATIAEFAGQLGLKGVDDIAAFTGTVARLADVSDLTAETAAEALGTLLAAFRLPATAAEALGSSLNALSNNTASTAGKIVDASQRVGALGAAFGLSADQVAAYSAVLVASGINAERAGTAFRTTLDGVRKESEAVAEVAGLTGEAWQKAVGDDANAALLLFLTNLSKLDSVARDTAIRGIFSEGFDALAVETLSQNLETATGGTLGLRDALALSADEYVKQTSLIDEYTTSLDALSKQWEIATTRAINAVIRGSQDAVDGLANVLKAFNRTTSGPDELADEVVRLREELGRLDQAEVALNTYRRLTAEGLTPATDQSGELRKAVDLLAAAFPGFIDDTDDAGTAVTLFADALGNAIEMQRQFNAAQATENIEAIVDKFGAAQRQVEHLSRTQAEYFRLSTDQAALEQYNLQRRTSAAAQLNYGIGQTALTTERAHRLAEEAGEGMVRFQAELNNTARRLGGLFDVAQEADMAVLRDALLETGRKADEADAFINALTRSVKALTAAQANSQVLPGVDHSQDDGTGDDDTTTARTEAEIRAAERAAKARLEAGRRAEEQLRQARRQLANEAIQDELQRELDAIDLRYDEEERRLRELQATAAEGGVSVDITQTLDDSAAARLREQAEARAKVAERERKATEALGDQVDRLKASLDEERGRESPFAAEIDGAEDLRDKYLELAAAKDTLAAAGDDTAQAEADGLRRQAQAADDLATSYRQLADARRAEAAAAKAAERVDELTALAKQRAELEDTTEAREAYVRMLNGQIRVQAEIADTAGEGSDEQLEALRKLMDAQGELNGIYEDQREEQERALDDLTRQVEQYSGILVDAFGGVLKGEIESVGDLAKEVGQQLLDVGLRLLNEFIAQEIARAVFAKTTMVGLAAATAGTMATIAATAAPAATLTSIATFGGAAAAGEAAVLAALAAVQGAAAASSILGFAEGGHVGRDGRPGPGGPRGAAGRDGEGRLSAPSVGVSARGLVVGPGATDRSDSIVARLTRGEHVVKVQPAVRYRAVLDAMNRGRPVEELLRLLLAAGLNTSTLGFQLTAAPALLSASDPSNPPRFADGGAVGLASLAATAGGSLAALAVTPTAAAAGTTSDDRATVERLDRLVAEQEYTRRTTREALASMADVMQKTVEDVARRKPSAPDAADVVTKGVNELARRQKAAR